MRVQVAPPGDLQWLVERTGMWPSAAFRALEAVDESGRIRGMVGYDTWMKSTCFMHVALDSPMAVRCLVRPAFTSLFEDAGYEVAMGLTRASNIAALTLARHLGFREVYRIRDGWQPGEDLVVSEMRKVACRWLARERKAA